MDVLTSPTLREESVGVVVVRKNATEVWSSRWLAFLGCITVVSLVLQHGFTLAELYRVHFFAVDLALVCGFAVGLALRILGQKQRREAFYRHRFEVILFGSLLLGMIGAFFLPAMDNDFPAHPELRQDLLYGLMNLFLLANVCIQGLRALQRIFVSGARLELLLAGSFFGAILLGMLLLLLPRAMVREGNPISLVDAIFTSTSAVCVTGLAVLDTGTDFSTLGQMIILALIQVGGLGIVTFVAFISAYSTKTLPVPQMVAFRQMINAPAIGDLKSRVAGIFMITVIIELLGAIALFFAYEGSTSLAARLKWSVFHSVSAFCNAGFSLTDNTLETYVDKVGINLTISALIILGGLGFLVIPEVANHVRMAVTRLPRLLRPRHERTQLNFRPKLSVQTKISLWVTMWLIVLGFLGFWALESANVLEGKNTGESALISFFQSVTTRTAGFNTIPVGELSQATLLLIIFLMVIGGSPVSTAGGIKTVTFGVLFFALRSMVLRREKIEAFGRTLPPGVFLTCLNVFVLYMTSGLASVFLLSIFDPHLSLRDTLFETISALSTVGLSTGITADLSNESKLVLCAAMFVGRVGPIALVFSVFQSRGKVEYEYPVEEVVVS